MATITTKYSVGETVYRAGTTMVAKQHPCPDCHGSRKWKATSPAGNEYEFACPRCTTRYQSNKDLNLSYGAHEASVRRIRIGSVQYNSASGAYDHGARYMESSTGSGSIYYENDLFPTEEEALIAANAKAAVLNATVPTIVDHYNKTLELSDYEFENAALQGVKRLQSRAHDLLWNMRELFDQIEQAADLDEAKEAVDEYRSRSWESDKQQAAESTA